MQRSLAFALLGSVLTVMSMFVFADDADPGADAPYNVGLALPLATVAAGCLGAALISFILRHLDEP
jgi:hypothetical protein